MALDAATAQLLEEMAAHGVTHVAEGTVEEARLLMNRLADVYGTGPEMEEARDRRVPVPGGFVAIRILRPVAEPVGVIVYFHGGGWVLGDISQYETLGRQLAARTACVVVLVDYRKAPEYRFPTAVDDAWAALQWTGDRVDVLAGRRVPLLVAGDSAGGNLAAVVAQRARARGHPELALQVLVCPVTDCDLDTLSYRHPDNQLMLDRDAMVWFWDYYAPVAADRTHPDASPLRLPGLGGLAPAVIVTAEHDVLRDEGELYATRLLQAGVPVRHRRFGGQMHGFVTLSAVLPQGRAALDFVAEGVADALERASAEAGRT